MKIITVDDFGARMGLGPLVQAVQLSKAERATLVQAADILERADLHQRRIDHDPDGDNDFHRAECSIREVLGE